MSGNSNSVTGGDGSFVITGGSVVGTTGLIMPCPVDAETNSLAGVVVSNLTAGAKIEVSGLPSTYGTDDIYADANGTILLWLPMNDLNNKEDAYTFTAGGSKWKVRIESVGFSFGTAVVPESVSIVSLSLSASGAKLKVTSDNPAWLKLNASSLRVMAASTPNMDESNAVIITPEITQNEDGSAELDISGSRSSAVFYKVIVK